MPTAYAPIHAVFAAVGKLLTGVTRIGVLHMPYSAATAATAAAAAPAAAALPNNRPLLLLSLIIGPTHNN
jgi:hypothetical protein